MRNLFKIISAISCFVGICGIAHASVPSNLPSDSVLRRQAARMLMVGFMGDSLTEDNPVVSYIRDLGVGGLVLFDYDLAEGGGLGKRNITGPAQVKKLCSDLKSLRKDNMLIAVDQEGGYVQRLKPRYGWEKIPSAYESAKGGDVSVKAAAEMAASQLKEAGINFNLAPVADLHNENSPAIGAIERAYSDKPREVARYDEIFIKAHRDAGIGTSLKHFPGHGSAITDTHKGFTDLTATWEERDLEPFEELITEGFADAVMTAHIFNAKIDSVYPASLSYATTTDLLRGKLGFDGLVITDDLYMEGVLSNFTIEEAIVLAVNAGADVLLAGNNLPGGFDALRPFALVDIIVRHVKNGDISYDRILDANRHIDKILGMIN